MLIFRIQAKRIASNKLIGLDPGEEAMGWDIENEFNAEESGWSERVHSSIPRIEEDELVLLRRLEKRFDVVESELGVGRDGTGDESGGQHSGTGAEEVTTEAQESGYVGPSEWEQRDSNK